MRGRTLGTLSGTLVLLVGVAAGVWGGVAAASGTCSVPSGCVLAVLAGGPAGAGTSQSVGGAGAPLTLTLTDNTPQPLESATLTPPVGFTLTATTVPNDGDSDDPPGSPPEIEVLNNVLEMRDLDVSAGGTFTVPGAAQLAATATCAATPATWSLVAYADDEWTGGVLTTDSSSALSVGVTGACSLKFAAEPASAVAGDNITNSIFDSSGSPVAVEALDANLSPIPGIPVTLAAEVGAGTLSGGTPPQTTGATSGLATFSPLTIGQTGYYYLEAGTTSPGFTPVSSSEFQITSAATACTSNCSGSVGDGPASVNVNVNNPGTGDLLSVVAGGYTYSCPDRFSRTGYYQNVIAPVGIDLWESDGSLDPTQRSEVVSITIPRQLVHADPKFLFFYEVCYASTEAFPGGTLVSGAASIPGFAGSTYVGLLRDCPWHNPGAAAPCVLSRTWNWRDGSLVITYLGAPGDFWGSA
jgi:hypothetical protein